MGAFYLISGNEDFSIKERANEFLRTLCGEIPEENPALEVIRGDNDSEKAGPVISKVLDAVETPSFLMPEKIVWLKHFNKFDEAAAEPSTKKNPSRLDQLAAFLKEGIPADVTLIIDGPMDRRKAFYKLCEKICESSGGKLEWFEKADVKSKGYLPNLIRRIKEIALDSGGKRMNEDAAAYLAETIGGDAARLKNEVDKLIAYAGENRVITLEDCFQVCSRASDTLSWEFASALAAKNPGKAMELIPGIIETIAQEKGSSSRPEIAIISGVQAEFQRLLAIRCEGLRSNIPDHADANYFYRLADEAKSAQSDSPLLSIHPFRAFKLWENAVRFSDKEFVRAFQAILTASRGMVTGSNPRLELENLVVAITGSGTAHP